MTKIINTLVSSLLHRCGLFALEKKLAANKTSIEKKPLPKSLTRPITGVQPRYDRSGKKKQEQAPEKNLATPVTQEKTPFPGSLTPNTIRRRT